MEIANRPLTIRDLPASVI